MARCAFPMTGYDPQDYAEDVRRMMALPEGFTIIKQPISFHSPMKREVPGYYYGEPERGPLPRRARQGRPDRARLGPHDRLRRSP